MAEPERTDQEIDDAIRHRIRLKSISDAPGVSRQRVQERCGWSRTAWRPSC